MTQKQRSLAEGKSNLNMFWQIAPLLLPSGWQAQAKRVHIS